MKTVLSKVTGFVNKHKMSVSGGAMSILSAVPVLAEEPSDAVIQSAGYISGDWLTGLVPAVQADVGTLVPVGVAIMAIFVGVGLIPRIIYKFIG